MNHPGRGRARSHRFVRRSCSAVPERERGQAAGAEVIVFGLLVFVVGVLVVANAWAVVDAKMAVATAARQAARAYVEAPPDSDPLALATDAAREAILGLGRDPQRLKLTLVSGELVRCSVVRFEARYTVPAIAVPWIKDDGEGFSATARHAEIVDPFRNGVPGTTSAACGQ